MYTFDQNNNYKKLCSVLHNREWDKNDTFTHVHVTGFKFQS